MIIDQKILDELPTHAKTSTQHRHNLELRNSPDDGSQRMLNAIEPGTVMPIHRHLSSSEVVSLLRGKLCWIFYDDAGNETERVLMDANGESCCIVAEKGRWHSLECLESGTVILECKDGAYRPLGKDEVMEGKGK